MKVSSLVAALAGLLLPSAVVGAPFFGGLRVTTFKHTITATATATRKTTTASSTVTVTTRARAMYYNVKEESRINPCRKHHADRLNSQIVGMWPKLSKRGEPTPSPSLSLDESSSAVIVTVTVMETNVRSDTASACPDPTPAVDERARFVVHRRRPPTEPLASRIFKLPLDAVAPPAMVPHAGPAYDLVSSDLDAAKGSSWLTFKEQGQTKSSTTHTDTHTSGITHDHTNKYTLTGTGMYRLKEHVKKLDIPGRIKQKIGF